MSRWHTAHLTADPRWKAWRTKPLPKGSDAIVKLYLGKKRLPNIPIETEGAAIFGNNAGFAKVLPPTRAENLPRSPMSVHYSTKTGFPHRRKVSPLTIRYRTIKPRKNRPVIVPVSSS